MALVSGIAEAKIIEVKNEHIYNEASRSVQKHGWLPGLFRGIIQKAKELLQGLIRETVIPPKPTPVSYTHLTAGSSHRTVLAGAGNASVPASAAYPGGCVCAHDHREHAD